MSLESGGPSQTELLDQFGRHLDAEYDELPDDSAVLHDHLRSLFGDLRELSNNVLREVEERGGNTQTLRAFQMGLDRAAAIQVRLEAIGVAQSESRRRIDELATEAHAWAARIAISVLVRPADYFSLALVEGRDPETGELLLVGDPPDHRVEGDTEGEAIGRLRDLAERHRYQELQARDPRSEESSSSIEVVAQIDGETGRGTDDSIEQVRAQIKAFPQARLLTAQEH